VGEDGQALDHDAAAAIQQRADGGRVPHALLQAGGRTRGGQFSSNGYGVARDLAQWKKRVAASWPRVQVRTLSLPDRQVPFGEPARFVVGVRSEDLAPQDIAVELLLAPAVREVAANGRHGAHLFTQSLERGEGGEHIFVLDLAPELCGKLEYRIRAYPYHPALSHRFEMGLMRWI
jgi:starch phosphorylase